jgi:glucose-6-phosphate isomerase, archaeal
MGLTIDWATGELTGQLVRSRVKKLGELREVFADQARLETMDPETLVYRVQVWLPEDGNPTGLLWGSTTIAPGKVGDEYFMTFGHFHTLRERPEIYAAIRGEGGLILMDENRRTWMEPMTAGSVHYIGAGLAHRVVNTGEGPLTFVASCNTDAGHDYESILRHGFGARLKEAGGRPVLVAEESLAGAGH